MKRNKLWAFMVLTVFMVVMLTACEEEGAEKQDKPPANPPEEQEQSGPVSGGELTVALFNDPPFDPLGFEKKDKYYTGIEQLVYQGLFQYNDDQKPVPTLVKDYKIKKSKDQIQFIMTLKDNIKWQDGSPLTIEDVVFSLKTWLDPFYYGAWRDDLSVIIGTSDYRAGSEDQIAGIHADPKKDQLILDLKEINVSFIHALTAPVLPKHQLQGKSFTEMNQLAREGRLLGVGPFKIKQKTENGLELTRFEGFYGKAPYLDTIVFAMKEGSFNAWKDEDIDIAKVAPFQLDQIPESYKTVAVTGKGYQYVGMNQQKKPLDKKEVRVALNQAISREQLIQDIFNKYADPMVSPVSSDSAAYNGNLQSVDYNLEAAKQTLEALGYNEGNPLQLSFTYIEGNPVQQELIQVLEKQWAKIHVEIKEEPLSRAEFVPRIFGGQPFDLYLFGGQFDRDYSGFQALWSSQEKAGELGLNALGYENKQADEALTSAMQAEDWDSFSRSLQKWQKIFVGDTPIIPLTIPNQVYVVDQDVQNAAIKSFRPYADIENWWLKP